MRGVEMKRRTEVNEQGLKVWFSFFIFKLKRFDFT